MNLVYSMILAALVIQSILAATKVVVKIKKTVVLQAAMEPCADKKTPAAYMMAL